VADPSHFAEDLGIVPEPLDRALARMFRTP
jgi:hypothetical protein